MVSRVPSRYPQQHPRCFLHVPKCGGLSVHAALLAALPPGSVSVKRYDHLVTRQPAPPGVREEVLLEEEELDAMSQCKVVCGHFQLSTLLRVAPPESVSTVLREPRTRLLSLYAYWRLIEFDEKLNPDREYEHAVRPLDDYLSEPLVAGGVDNVVCRYVLDGDTRIPHDGFIPAERVEELAADAIDRLDQLGFVGVLERRQAMWDGLSRFFGVTLEPTHENVTGALVPDAVPLHRPISGRRTLDLLHARTAVDAIVYRHALTAQSTEEEAEQISDATFAAQLVRLGDVAGESALAAQQLAHRVAYLTEELARHRAWLEGMQGSVSWRITRPLRSAKRRMFASKSR